ncbi:MAG: capsular biosynthesis protein, partial [Waterburya sp.]
GVLPPSPATLLDSQRMRMLISYWSERYDFVIIDTPAIDFAPDAPIIGRMVDGVLLAVKLGKVERVKAHFTKQILEQSGQNVLGMVLNGINLQTESRSYYYYHSLENNNKQQSSQSPPMKLLDSSKQDTKP